MINNINDFAKAVHENAVNHGWWDEDKKPSFPEVIAMCHCELSEAINEYRNGNPMVYYNDGKPEGVAVELADCILRILDYCGYADIDIDSVLTEKHAYNQTREYRHGGKKI